MALPLEQFAQTLRLKHLAYALPLKQFIRKEGSSKQNMTEGPTKLVHHSPRDRENRSPEMEIHPPPVEDHAAHHHLAYA